MVVGYSRGTVGKVRRVEGRWSAVGVSMQRTKPGRSYWKDGAGGVRRVAEPRAPLVLTRIRSALGGVGSLRDHVSISEAETGDVEGRGKAGLAPPRRRRVTWIVHSLSSP